ncbi:MAG TPA: DNA alkylation repair protein [Actinomycetota bacterium]|nr:DNA alkylation repair protein [Actinomycetota bacterium]
MDVDQVLQRLRALESPRDREGMARFGINPDHALGISVTKLRAIAKETGRDHDLALELWASGIHEARILATIVDDPELVSKQQMQSWVEDFDSWDLCDQACMNLFWRVDGSVELAFEWASLDDELVKRAAFALMARFATKRAKAPDDLLESFLPVIEKAADDDRNYVRKAVNWALRGIGKRNLHLNELAIASAGRIRARDTKSAGWIANDALQELTSDKVRARLETPR